MTDMAIDTSLPAAFAELEPFVARWAVTGTAARGRVRDAAGVEEAGRFLAAAGPHAGAALDYLDGRGFSAFDAADQRLMDLMLGLAHAGLAAEILGPDEAAHMLDRQGMTVVRSPADGAPAVFLPGGTGALSPAALPRGKPPIVGTAARRL